MSTPLDKQAASRTLLASVLTDVQFWVPFVVLLLGLGILVICAKS